MNNWIKVARYHLVDPRITMLPWAIEVFNFLLAAGIAVGVGGPGKPAFHSGAVFAIYVFAFAMGILCIKRSLPFGLSLGLTRRSYYAGTVFVGAALAAVYGLVLAVLQVIEDATNGWGLRLYFFRVSFLLNGPWYLTWLTSFVLLTLAFVWGSWFGLVYWRWNMIGMLSFTAAQTIALAAAAVIVTRAHAWHSVGHFFTNLSAAGLTGLLAVLAILLLAGGLSTVRRVTV